MATRLANFTPTTRSVATWATKVPTSHGLVTVESYYDALATVWRHRMASHSEPGIFRTVIAGACNCPSRRQCWHEKAAAAAEAMIHETLWSVMRYEFALDASADAYARGLATLDALRIPSAGAYRETRAATIAAMEVLHG